MIELLETPFATASEIFSVVEEARDAPAPITLLVPPRTAEVIFPPTLISLAGSPRATSVRASRLVVILVLRAVPAFSMKRTPASPRDAKRSLEEDGWLVGDSIVGDSAVGDSAVGEGKCVAEIWGDGVGFQLQNHFTMVMKPSTSSGSVFGLRVISKTRFCR